MKIGGDVASKIKSLKYFGSFVQNNGGLEEDGVHRIKWREMSGVSCDERMPMKMER